MSGSINFGFHPRLDLRQVLHYAACAIGIAIGFLGFGFSAMQVLISTEPESPMGGVILWLTFGGVFAWELVYRPPNAVSAGIGTCALLLLVVWLAANVLVAVIF
jgi:hypothetical protein